MENILNETKLCNSLKTKTEKSCLPGSLFLRSPPFLLFFLTDIQAGLRCLLSLGFQFVYLYPQRLQFSTDGLSLCVQSLCQSSVFPGLHTNTG